MDTIPGPDGTRKESGGFTGRDIGREHKSGIVAFRGPGAMQGQLIQAEYGYSYIFGNSAPCFGITGTIWRRKYKDIDSGGCLHDEIAKHFPKLRPLIKWHLVDQGGQPMHYLENAVYWWQLMTGRRERHRYETTDAERAFKSTIVYGARPEDAEEYEKAAADGWHEDGIRYWLKSRLRGMAEAMDRELSAAGVERIPGALHVEVLERKEDGSPKLIRQWWKMPEGVKA